MKKILLLIFVTIYACAPIQFPIPKEVARSFTQCYKSGNIHADAIIRLDGYYTGCALNNNKTVNSYLFFNDGTVAMNVTWCGGLLPDKDLKSYPTTWGTYVIKDDTIIAQLIQHNFESSSCFEIRFKIINKQSFWKISTFFMDENELYLNDSSNEDFIKPFTFNKLNEKPDSTCWLKEKKWFWCNEEDWKKYMIERKNSK